MTICKGLFLLFMAFQSDPASLENVELDDGLVISTWAESPLVEDPVAICIDANGRVFVAETFRQEHGVEDNRSQPYWLLDDLAAVRIEDRLAKYQKWSHKRENGMDWYTQKEDRIRCLEDTDGDGRADSSTIFADGFNEPLDGTGAGLIVNGDELWYTCIPNLWRLRDEQDDCVAEVREIIYSGFGVRDALRGHDMHGLTWGPDGRLYWSIGDRGYHVELPDGRILSDPHSGAVFRCEPDGSDLELFHTGLRNPQELAFDRFGYLFTGDNNSDGGDLARIVYCAEGGETGWEMNYQTLEGENNRGPWMQEGIWETSHEGRPAWALPPLRHVGSGPSGFVFYPGRGLSDRYDDHFFMCNFLGSPQHSGIISMEMVPDGAGFQVEDVHDFIKGVLCTDVDFNMRGSMLIADWVEGWLSTRTGRLLEVADPACQGINETSHDILITDFSSKETARLIELLSHVDQRIRRWSQFELARRGETASLTRVALDPNALQMARIHSIWALGMIDRRLSKQIDQQRRESTMKVVEALVWDEDPEIRAQAIRVLGEAGHEPSREDLQDSLFDEMPRVIYESAIALGKIGNSESIEGIVEMIAMNDNEDPWLRHAGVMALCGIDDRSGILELLGDPQAQVRLAAVLALRKLHDPAVALLLRDQNPQVAAEAARAIHDVPIEQGDSALADLLPVISASKEADRSGRTYRAVVRRSLSASLRLGDSERARMIARFALDGTQPEILRREAMEILGSWPEPSPRDRVQGRYRPSQVRDVEEWRTVMSAVLPPMSASDDLVSVHAREIAAAYDIALDSSLLETQLDDESNSSEQRISALDFLVEDPTTRTMAIHTAAASKDQALRSRGLELSGKWMTADAIEWLIDALESGSPADQQAAIRGMGHMSDEPVLKILRERLDLVDEQDAFLALDVVEASRKQSDSEMADKIAWWDQSGEKGYPRSYQLANEGGNPSIGRDIVFHDSSATCLRCHQIDGSGGIAGPDLTDVGARLDSTQLLDSLLDPGAEIAEGFGEASAMPAMTPHLDPMQIRDVVAYLETLRQSRE